MRRSVALLGGVVLALVASQFPEYAQQYTQRLGGAVDELRTITTAFDSEAAAAGLTRDQAIARYTGSSDSFLKRQGGSMTRTFARYQQLTALLAEVRGDGPIDRLRHLPDYFDTDIGARTLDDFKPALPATEEGLLYALVGLLVGYAVTSALWSLLMLPFRLLFRRLGWTWGRA
jgi:hypothetical protein